MKELSPKKKDATNSIDLAAVVELLFDIDSSRFIHSYFISCNRIIYSARFSKSSKTIISVFNLFNGA
jgi:hypothetical protein